MKIFDLALVNGRIYLDGSWLQGNLYVKDGRIATLSGGFYSAAEIHDVGGNWILPGFIDPHVHLDMNAGRYHTVDDFAAGSAAMALGGVTTLIDFTDTAGNPEQLERQFIRRRSQAAGAVIDFGLHACVAGAEEGAVEIARQSRQLGMPTIKMFTTYRDKGLYSSSAAIGKMLAVTREEQLRVLVHAEAENLLNTGEVPVDEHALARPAGAEKEAAIQLAALARNCDGRLYLVHVSAGSTLHALTGQFSAMLGEGLLLESCPHYFTFTADCYQRRDAYLYTMTPPLRSSREVEQLRDQIDRIDVVGSDHCSFAAHDKQQPFTAQIPMGIAGAPYSFLLMFSLFGEKVIDKFCRNTAAAHGLLHRKGTLLPGTDADIVVFDPQSTTRIIPLGVGSCIYEGMEVRGRIIDVVSRGRFVVQSGRLIGGRGEYVARRLD